jgi:GntR family transcriptional regulator
MNIHDLSGERVSAAEQARRRLLERITAGALGPGERLGAERELAPALGVSRSTVRQALSALEADGVISRVPGRGGGTFVRPQKVERDLARITSVPALLRSQGMPASTRVLSAALAPADRETGAALGLATGEYVIELVRVRLADSSPISLERARLPARFFPGLLDRPLGGSLYELLEEHYRTVPGEATERIEVVTATGTEASVLGVASGSALLSITRTTKDAGGRRFEFSHDLFRADRTVITHTTVTGPRR